MANFGDVLRGLGSVLNPQVAEEVAAENRQREQQAQQREMLVYGQIQKGVHDGSIDPAQLPPELRGLMGGPSAEAQQKLAEVKILQGAGSANMQDPAFLERMGVALKRPEFITHAERLRKSASQDAELANYRSSPDNPGLFSALVDSENPYISRQAKMFQAQLDKAGNVIPPNVWETKRAALSTLESHFQESKRIRTERAESDRPLTDIGRLNADLKAGRITQEQHDASAGIKLGTTGRLTPEAIDAAAARYNIDGTTPSNLGRGVQGSVNMSLILSKAAQNSFDQGDTAEGARLRQIANKSASSALGQLSKQKNLILAFEKNAIMNADLVLDRSEKVDRLGSPVIDRWIQAGKKNIAGDVGVAELDTAMRTFINEYARVTTTVTGGGVTSDTARHEIDGLLRSAQTKEQVRGVIKLMKQEMENRRIGYDQQEQELLSGISRGPRNAATPAPAAPVLPPPGQSQGQPSVDDLVKKYGGNG